MPPRSAVDALPDEVRRWLDLSLAEGNFAGYEQISTELAERGYGISKSAVHRYGQKLERRLAAIKASTEAARAIADAAPDAADQRSAAVISLVQSDLFEMLLKLQDADDPETKPEKRVAILSDVAMAMAQLTKASIAQKRHEQAIRDKAIQEAAEKATTLARAKGLSRDTVDELRREILGVA